MGLPGSYASSCGFPVVVAGQRRSSPILTLDCSFNICTHWSQNNRFRFCHIYMYCICLLQCKETLPCHHRWYHTIYFKVAKLRSRFRLHLLITVFYFWPFANISLSLFHFGLNSFPAFVLGGGRGTRWPYTSRRLLEHLLSDRLGSKDVDPTLLGAFRSFWFGAV